MLQIQPQHTSRETELRVRNHLLEHPQTFALVLGRLVARHERHSVRVTGVTDQLVLVLDVQSMERFHDL